MGSLRDKKFINQRFINFLGSKQVKEIVKLIEKQWNVNLDWNEKYYFVKNLKDKIFIINKDVNKLNIEDFRIDKIGLYVAEIGKEIRLSIEGAQLIGPLAKKNVVEVSEEKRDEWMKGQDIRFGVHDQGFREENSPQTPNPKPSTTNYNGFVIIKCGEDYLGSGKFREGIILNHVPKSRRVH